MKHHYSVGRDPGKLLFGALRDIGWMFLSTPHGDLHCENMIQWSSIGILQREASSTRASATQIDYEALKEEE